MHAQKEKPKENKSRAVANSVGQKKSREKTDFGFVDNRPVAAAQKKIQESAHDYSGRESGGIKTTMKIIGTGKLFPLQSKNATEGKSIHIPPIFNGKLIDKARSPNIAQLFQVDAATMRDAVNMRGYRMIYWVPGGYDNAHITIEPDDVERQIDRGGNVTEYTFIRFHYTEQSPTYGNLRVGFEQINNRGGLRISWTSGDFRNAPEDIQEDVEERAWAAADDFRDAIGY